MSNRGSKKNFSTIQSLTTFGHALTVVQIILLLLFAVFVRMKIPTAVDTLQTQRLLGFLAANAMAIGGFGLFMSFGQNYQFSPISFVLLMVVVAWQFHVLMYAFWERIFMGFQNYPVSIEMDIGLLNRAARCGFSAVIGLTGVAGRVSPKDLLKLLPIFVLGYTCGEIVIQQKLQVTDPGGTMIIFAYASTVTLMFSFVLGKKVIPTHSIQQSYRSINFALLGTFLLWCFWPVFNCAIYSVTSFDKTLIITNTIFSMAGSVISMTVLTAFYKEGLSMLVLHRATVVGGVVIGCNVHIVYFPAIALTFGVLAGVVGFFSLRHLQGRCEMAWGLLDTSGVLSFGMLPSILGGVGSSVMLVAYYYNGLNDKVVGASNPNGVLNHFDTLNTKGGYYTGALFISMGLGGTVGLVAGFLVAISYRQKPETFYADDWHFDVQLPQEEEVKTEYNLEAINPDNKSTSTRMHVPESSERFHEEGQDSEYSRKKPKKKFKTRYGT